MSVHVYIVLVVVNLCVVLATKALIFQWIFTRRPLSPMDLLILLDELEKVFGFVYLSMIVLSNFDMLNEPTMIQVWSLTQLYSVDFSQSRIGLKKCVFNKCTIKVCVSCC